MAEVLHDFDFAQRNEGGYPVRYDWASWLDGQVWQLKQGEDFAISLPNFRNSVFVAASKLNLKVRTTTNKADGTVIIQALPAEEPPAAAVTRELSSTPQRKLHSRLPLGRPTAR